MQFRLRNAALAFPVQRQLQQQCCKGSLRCDGKNATPALHPGAAGSNTQGRRCRCCACARKWADELRFLPKTTRPHRRALSSPGWVWRRLRWAAWSRAKAGRASAPARGSPVLPTGLTMVASTASCAPCHGGKPLHTTSMRLASCTEASRFMSAKRTFWATRAPASRQTRASALSSGMARAGNTPAVAQAARWSPQGSSWPRQWQCLGASGRGRRSLRSRSARNCVLMIWKQLLGIKDSAPVWSENSVKKYGNYITWVTYNVTTGSAKVHIDHSMPLELFVAACESKIPSTAATAKERGMGRR